MTKKLNKNQLSKACPWELHCKLKEMSYKELKDHWLGSWGKDDPLLMGTSGFFFVLEMCEKSVTEEFDPEQRKRVFDIFKMAMFKYYELGEGPAYILPEGTPKDMNDWFKGADKGFDKDTKVVLKVRKQESSI